MCMSIHVNLGMLISCRVKWVSNGYNFLNIYVRLYSRVPVCFRELYRTISPLSSSGRRERARDARDARAHATRAQPLQANDARERRGDARERGAWPGGTATG